MSKREMVVSALMLAMIAAAASARADAGWPAAPDAIAAYDYEQDKARANYGSARDRCAEAEGTHDRCEKKARADYKSRLAMAQKRYAAGGQPLANTR